MTPLATFLADRDTPCPNCAYNLRGCTIDHCPECNHRLELIVALEEPRAKVLIAAAVGAGAPLIGWIVFLIVVVILSITKTTPSRREWWLVFFCPLLGLATQLVIFPTAISRPFRRRLRAARGSRLTLLMGGLWFASFFWIIVWVISLILKI